MDLTPPSLPAAPGLGATRVRRARRRILGIDPGSRTTGYALIDSDGTHSTRVVSGSIRVAHAPWPGRLGLIFDQVAALVHDYAPDEMAVEQLIFARDPVAALKLGQARGAIICAALQGGVQVHEYSPKSVKQAVVGTGAAEKSQVQHMVRLLLALDAAPGEDEADALALALCHAHSLGLPVRKRAAASWRDWRPTP